MIRHAPSGWNTWDYRGFNRLVYLRDGRVVVSVQYAIWDESARPKDEVKNRGGLHRTFRWTDVTRLGSHAPLGLPASLEFNAGDATFRAEAFDRDGALELTVTPLSKTKQRVVFTFLAPDDETPEVRSPTAGTFAECPVEFDGAAWPSDYFINIAEPYAIGRPGAPATIRVFMRSVATASVASDLRVRRIDDGRPNVGLGGPTLHGSGALADAPEAMVSAVTWNTLYDTRRKLVSSPVSRDWCQDWKGVAVFCWDTYLLGAFISYESQALARLNFETVTAAIDELGMVPNYYMSHGAVSKDRSMPPLGSYMIWKVQQPAPDRDWLRSIYPRLRIWHKFWFTHRDGNNDGLLEAGSSPTPKYEFPQLLSDNPQLQHSAKCAMYEAGADNSPMYDDVPFNQAANTLELIDVGLNSYFAMDCMALAAIADCLNETEHAAAYRQEFETLKIRFNQMLWNDQHGIYCNRHWDGRFSERWSPTSFFPLIAGLAPQERAERMVRQHLLNEDEFWGDCVLPSIARNDPAYPDNDYWRGRIWPPLNFLVAEGLRRYRFDDVAAQLAQKGLDMFMRNWREDGGVYENYNADTGAGGDVWNAARLYHWGGLLVFIALQELIDLEPAGFLRFGSLDFPNSGVDNVRLGDDIYDVRLDDGLHVRRNGMPYVEANQRAIVRIPIDAPVNEPIQVTAAPGARITFHSPQLPSRPPRSDTGELKQQTAQHGSAVYVC